MSDKEQHELFGGEIDAEALARLDDPEAAAAMRAWPVALTRLVGVITAGLKRCGHPDDKAKREAQVLVVAIANDLGGRMHYLPRGDRLRIALRDNTIWHEFDGHNVQRLADKYGITAIQIYKIIREQRRVHRRQRELLF